MALREILAAFEIKVDDKALKALEGGLEGTVNKLKAVAAAFTGGLLVNEVSEFIGHQIELGSQINDTAEKLGVGTEELQQFQYAAKLSGVEAESAAQSLGFLNKNIGEAISGNATAAKTFADLHVQIKNSDGTVRELGDVLPDVADAFVKVGSAQQRTAIAMSIFGRSGAQLVPILNQGSDGLEDLYKEFDRLGGSLSEDFIHGADEAGDELDKLKFSFEGLKSRIAVTVFPTLITLTKYLEEVSGSLVHLSKETNVIKVGLYGLAGASGFGALRLLASLSKSLGFTTKAAEGLGGGLKAIFNLGFKGGLLLTALTGIALVAEDIYTLFTGGQSAIGEWLDKLGGVGAAQALVDDVTASFRTLGQAIVDAGLTTDAFKSDAGAAFKWVFDFVIGGVSQLIEWFGDLAKGITWVVDAAKSIDWAGIFAAREDGGTGAAQAAPSAGKYAENMARRAAQRLTFTGKETIGGLDASTNLPATVPLPPGMRPKNPSAAGAGAGNSISNTVTVTVQGGSNPQETGRNVSQGVKDALSGQNNDALNAMLQLGGS